MHYNIAICNIEIKKEIASDLTGVVLGALLALILFGWLFQLGMVRGNSMAPTICPGDIVLSATYAEIARGDIVSFAHDGRVLIKRVAAVGGETIMYDGVTYTVPADHLFVLGDNSKNSYDSRDFDYPYVPVSTAKKTIIHIPCLI